MTVLTDIALWNLLFQGYGNQKPHRYSKAEAFFDLINRERLAVLTGDGKFVNSTIQTLANVWSWDRTTVKKFVDTLCAIGAASVTTEENKYTVRLKNISGLSPQNGASPQKDHHETVAHGVPHLPDEELRNHGSPNTPETK